jgi:cation:H+ antiporter
LRFFWHQRARHRATIVAVGTSIPEPATTIIAKLQGHDEVGLEMVLGSNIFNSLLVIAMAAIIGPIAVGWPRRS